jgi:hypothetical protein
LFGIVVLLDFFEPRFCGRGELSTAKLARSGQRIERNRLSQLDGWAGKMLDGKNAVKNLFTKASPFYYTGTVVLELDYSLIEAASSAILG